MAQEAYQPFVENENWNEEYKSCFRKMVENETAPGFGLIPNCIIKEKITQLISQEMEEKNKANIKEQQRLQNLFKLAKETGKKQLIEKHITGCCDKDEECNMDIHYSWAMPDGNTKKEWSHTW